MQRVYTYGAIPRTSLQTTILSGATSLTIADATGWPTVGPFPITLERGTVNEEQMICSGRSGTTLNISQRGANSTTAQTHVGSTTTYVEHTLSADVLDQLNEALAVPTTKGDILGYDGSDFQRLAVGTNNYVLTADSTQTTGFKWALNRAFDLITAAGQILVGDAADSLVALTAPTANDYVLKRQSAGVLVWGVDPVQDKVTNVGDLLYGSTADALTRLAIGTQGQVLVPNASANGYNWTTRSRFSDQDSSDNAKANNNTTETIIGTLSLSGFEVVAGNIARMVFHGIQSGDTASVPTFRIRFGSAGGTATLSDSSVATSISGTNLGWRIVSEMAMTTTSAQTNMNYEVSHHVTAASAVNYASTSTTTVDISAGTDIVLTVQWNNTSGTGNTVSCLHCFLELLTPSSI